jgi:hypothetical protein
VIDIAHTLQRHGPPTVRLAIPSGRVLPTVGFAAWSGALRLGGRWPDAGAPDRAGVVSAAWNSMLMARATALNAAAVLLTACQPLPRRGGYLL